LYEFGSLKATLLPTLKAGLSSNSITPSSNMLGNGVIAILLCALMRLLALW
jgi:hypothetical protein